MSTDSRVAPESPEKHLLTLADLVFIRAAGQKTTRLSGVELGRVIDALDDSAAGPLVDPHTIGVELLGLADVVRALSETDSDPAAALGFVAEALRKIAQRVFALEPCENSKASAYQVEVVPIRSR
jgi:hypothetical protein